MCSEGPMHVESPLYGGVGVRGAPEESLIVIHTFLLLFQWGSFVFMCFCFFCVFYLCVGAFSFLGVVCKGCAHEAMFMRACS